MAVLGISSHLFGDVREASYQVPDKLAGVCRYAPLERISPDDLSELAGEFLLFCDDLAVVGV